MRKQSHLPLEDGPATIQYGFKRVTWSNHLEQDHHPAYPSKMRGEQWAQACWKPQLIPSVPKEIAFLFEVARGSMIYGLYFLPLASLASEQCYRVLEAGARQRWKDLGLSKKIGGKKKVLSDIPFSEVIAALRKAGRIPQIDSDAWSVIPFESRGIHFDDPLQDFTPRARTVFGFAKKHSARLRHNFTGTEHLILGLCGL
jgi:ATPases with chaperone activity, ATP-binding subunit